MRLSRLAVVLSCLVVVALASACPGPAYPKCTSDEHCTRAKNGGKSADEHCLFGQCQECAQDSHCDAPATCSRGRCEAPPAAAAAPQTPAAVAATTPAAAPCPASATVRFDFNAAELRDDSRASLDAIAACFAKTPPKELVVEGHCDERGTTEYNLALGARRAEVIRDYLARLGVDRAKIKTVSYGKERPVDRRSSEEAWAVNRRAELAASL